MSRKVLSLLILAAIALSVTAPAHALDDLTRAKILASGVNEASLDRILAYIKKNRGASVSQDVYSCKTREASNVRICSDRDREKICRAITIASPRYVVSIDFSRPSDFERFYFIDLKTGAVEKYLATHGRGSGKGRWAYKFSNIRDSEQSSLGLFQVGESFQGGHGEMLRLYGLERSNDQAYNRDIVMHAAIYAKPEFVKRINPKTKAPFGRLGLSWGCPAIAPAPFKKLLPLLKNGSILDLYHPKLMEYALSGHEVRVDEPEDEPAPEPIPDQVPLPRPRPNTAPTPVATPRPK